MYQIFHADCFDWLRERERHSLHAVCTDPPYGLLEFTEKEVSNHPCLKPQHFMRIIVRALLPLGEGVLLDPFMGSGSTIAAADAVGYESLGVEVDADYFGLAGKAIPRLAVLYPNFKGQVLEMETNYGLVPEADEKQMALVLSEPPAPYRVNRPKAMSQAAGRRG